MLRTEMRNKKSTHLDRMSTGEMIRLIHEETLGSVRQMEQAFDMIERAVDAAAKAIDSGGRVFYIGAGTSGRLGVLDAAECPPTYGVSRDLVVGIIAGGERSLMQAVENAEDDEQAGVRDLLEHRPGPKDLLVGISAAGTAKYVLGAIRKAAELGCLTVGISNNPGCPLDTEVDLPVCIDTGPEVVTGSTRMKAGTVQKLVLNMISTCAMVKTGKVYGNMMINLRPTNEKLRRRMIRIAREITGDSLQGAQRSLERYGWNLRAVLDEAQAAAGAGEQENS